MRTLRFEGGTLVLEGFPPGELPPGFKMDHRTGFPRGMAMNYRHVVLDLHRRKLQWRDHARQYERLTCEHRTDRTPRFYQREAVDAWEAAGRNGVVVLPTGAGKSFVAELAIASAGRDTLVVVPTLALVRQWRDGLRAAFGVPIGVIGGGEVDLQPITVSTYDSAWMRMDRLGTRFGLIVFDEVHHLPAAQVGFAAEGAIAPFRLGLTATLEREDGQHSRLDGLVGRVVYRKEITELAGEFLAPYRTEVITVDLSARERQAYVDAERVFRDFLQDAGIRLGGPNGWNQFLRAAGRSSAGRAAHQAWLTRRKILQATDEKLQRTVDLLTDHAQNRVIVFTADNATVYQLSRRLLLPAITHQTSNRERSVILDGFAEGTFPAIVTSRVLNEGVDVPAADVAIVLSGTSTVREHVQRLGRILRPKGGKQAVLYEIVVSDTAEERVSARRRGHAAYDGPPAGSTE